MSLPWKIPIGTPTAMKLSATVSMTGDRGANGEDPNSYVAGTYPGAGFYWYLYLGGTSGGGPLIKGGVIVSGGAIVSTGRIYAPDNTLLGTFTGSDSATVECTWTEQWYAMADGVGRSVVGDVSITANGVTVTYTPSVDVLTGLNTPPNMWVYGSTDINSFSPETLSTSATTSMNVTHMGPSAAALTPLNIISILSRSLITVITSPVHEWAHSGNGTWSADGTSASWESLGNQSLILGDPPAEYGGGNTWDTYNDRWNNNPWGNGLPFAVGGSSGSISLVNVTVQDTIPVASVAQEWPSGNGIPGVPISLYNNVWALAGPGQCIESLSPWGSSASPDYRSRFADQPVHTDAEGKGPTKSFTATGLYPKIGTSGTQCRHDLYPAGAIGQDIRGDDQSVFPTSPVADDDAHYLWRHNLDPRGLKSSGTGSIINVNAPGRDALAQIELWTSPTLVTVTRATSKAIDDGSDSSLWQTLGGDPANWSADARVSISLAGGGVQFSKTGTSNYSGIGRLLSTDPGKRRAFRLFRWCKVRINASAKTSVRIGLYNNFNASTSNPLLCAEYTLTLAAGDNDIELDLARCKPILETGGTYLNNPAAPVVRQSADSTAASSTCPDILGLWSLCSANSTTTVTSVYKDTSGNPPIGTGAHLWQNADCWWIRIDHLTAGVTYTLKEITCHDRTDGNRTPLRVLGDPSVRTAYTTYNYPDIGGGLAGDVNSLLPEYVLRVLVNGRPVAGFPSCLYESSDWVYIDDLLARWADTIDGGAGVWSFSNAHPELTSVIPVSMLEVVPGSVTQTGFQLRARACYYGIAPNLQTPGVYPGWSTVVGTQIRALYQWGSVIEGIAIDGNTRAPLAGQTVALTMTNHPAQATDQQALCACDDDGYFAISQRQPIMGVTGGYGGLSRYVDVLRDDGLTATTPWYCWHRNSLHLMVLTHPQTPGSVANLADVDGTYHRVGRTFYTLTGSTVVGSDGLAYWRYDAGAPRAWNSYHWTATAVIISSNLNDDNPCIIRRHDGRLIVVFDRQTASGPRVASTWETYSDDDGLTWSDPAMTINDGQYPRIRVGKDGSIWRTAYVDDGSGQGIGTISGQFQYTGDTSPRSAVTFKVLDNAGGLVPIVIQGGRYDIDHLAETASRWILTCVEVGATTPTEFVNADDAGGTWIRLGATDAGTALGPGGDMAFRCKAFESSVNVPTTGVQSVNGVTTGDGETFYLGANTITSENGPWITSTTGVWSRPSWFASGSTQQPGSVAFVAPGGTNGGKFINCSNTSPYVVDTDVQTWVVTIPPVSVHVKKDRFPAPISSATLHDLSATPNGDQFDVLIDGRLMPDTADYYTYPGTGPTPSLSVDLGSSVTLSDIASEVIVRYTY